MITKNSEVIQLLCSHLCLSEGLKPLDAKEWTFISNTMAENHLNHDNLFFYSEIDFKEIFNFDSTMSNRIIRLINRGKNFFYEIDKYEEMGIYIMTREDNKFYPTTLKTKLTEKCPPLLYYAGNPTLLNNKYIGFVGSRSIDSAAEDFTINTVDKINKSGYGVVSGGAKGIDSISVTRSLQNGVPCVEYLSDSLKRKVKIAEIAEYIKNDKLLLLSQTHPEAGFDTGMAMSRNKLIYAQSEATIIVKSDLKKGGTWTGATENLKKRFCPSFCWNNKDYPGNIELIHKGAYPIDEDWDGNIEVDLQCEKEKEKPQQMKLF